MNDYKIKKVNENGLKFIREILDKYHVEPERTCEKEYAKDVEFALSELCDPILEIPALYSINGCTRSWVLSEDDITTYYE